ncbi:hypothetical protein OSA54_01165, partial [Treponema pallidum]
MEAGCGRTIVGYGVVALFCGICGFAGGYWWAFKGNYGGGGIDPARIKHAQAAVEGTARRIGRAQKGLTDARREIGEGRQGLGGIGARIERIERVDRDIEKRIGDIEAACERIEHAVEAFRD